MGLAFDLSFQHQLARESWTMYGIGMFFIVFRMYARIHRVGLRNLQLDDYLMLVAASFYTILVVCLNVIAGGGGSNLFPPEQLSTFTPEEIRERIKGSKIVVLSEQGMLNVIYTIKTCMLLMYGRLTLGSHQARIVRWIGYYVAMGWVATEVAFFLACRPFNGYWAVPPPNPQCTTLYDYAITQATFNISSDMCMLAVMLPLLAKMNMPFKQRLTLLVIFSMGSFVIIAALLTKIFNLIDPYSTVYMLWYVRESSVAVYVSNLPMIWPLLREWFPYLRRLTPGYKATSREGDSGAQRNTFSGRKNGSGLQMRSVGKNKYGRGSQFSMGTETDIERSNSSERINKPPFHHDGILAETTINVDVESANVWDVEKKGGVHTGVRNTWDRSDSSENSFSKSDKSEGILNEHVIRFTPDKHP